MVSGWDAISMVSDTFEVSDTILTKDSILESSLVFTIFRKPDFLKHLYPKVCLKPSKN